MLYASTPLIDSSPSIPPIHTLSLVTPFPPYASPVFPPMSYCISAIGFPSLSELDALAECINIIINYILLFFLGVLFSSGVRC